MVDRPIDEFETTGRYVYSWGRIVVGVSVGQQGTSTWVDCSIQVLVVVERHAGTILFSLLGW